MTSETLYPKYRTEKDFSARAWKVKYSLAYDGGGGEWTGYYRTKTGAKISAWWNYHIASYGGSAVLSKNK